MFGHYGPGFAAKRLGESPLAKTSGPDLSSTAAEQ